MSCFVTDDQQQMQWPITNFADNPIYLAPENYPNQAWTDRTAAYNRWWSYYKGFALNKKNKKNVEIYPIKLNLVRSAVINHAAVFLGQYDDNGIIQFSLKSIPGLDEATVEATNLVMNMLWAINNGDDLLIENAILAQVFGGAFWKVAWHPIRRKWPIRYFSADPRACFPVWDGDDYNRMVSIDVYQQIPVPTAQVRYRADFKSMNVTSEAIPEYVSVHEHWNENDYFIKFNEEIGKYPDGQKMQGKNPFSDPVLGIPIIPYAYMPRVRAGEYFGESVVPGLIGPQDTINNDMAHLSEGLADAMHQQPWVRDRAKGTQNLNRNRSEWLNLGETRPGSKFAPEVGRLDGAQITDPMKDFVVDDLQTMARESTNMPNVAYGRTDASIRSALTLKFMMWPATNLGLHYRRWGASALKQLNYLAFCMAHSKANGNLGIEKVNEKQIEAILVAHKTQFPPMLPDDRAELVNEIIQRMSAELISPRTAIRRLDGPDQLEEELNLIDEHREALAKKAEENMEKQAEIQAKHQPSPTAQGASGSIKVKPPDKGGSKKQADGGRKSSPS